MLVVVVLINIISFAPRTQSKVILCEGKYAHSYHKMVCTGLKQCKGTRTEVTLKAAIDAGHDPCDYCYGPEKVKSGSTTPVPFKSKTAANGPGNRSNRPATSQCAAITKKGTQCSRAATANGYCWQHGK